MSSTTTSELTQKYQQKTDKQHILDNPDTYIGSIELIESNVWILDKETNKIIQKEISYIPGLFKLFDEGIVNCRDHVVRMNQLVKSNTEYATPVTNIDITIEDDGTICMFNDGNGVDVAEHPEYTDDKGKHIWIPELIFGHLRTSTNYAKDEKRIVGGKNGFGFKLVLIWSTEGYIETVDHIRGLKYRQHFDNNLDNIKPPKISKCAKSKPYTKISFKPDYARFGIPDGLSSDVVSLLKKRVYDIAAITDKAVKVRSNSAIIPIKSFQQYVDMYIGDKSETVRLHETPNDRWEYVICLTPTSEFCQMSFVNGIHTSKGGKHVDYIVGQITRKLIEYIEKKKKVKVNGNSIKEQLMIFLRCDIDNPAFDSQTKDYMNTSVAKFGSKCEVSDKFIEKIAKLGVMNTACALNDVKSVKDSKKTDGSKTKNIRGINQLTDANWAGTSKSNQCILLCGEGDSAVAGIRAGLTTEDRNIFGIYALRGKMLNVRGEAMSKISKNKEIQDLKKILGLETEKNYKTIEDVHNNLRYSKILFMTDQDLDGSHITGLAVNVFQYLWPSLLKLDDFCGYMNTPILKARKNSQTLVFYNDGEYNEWKNTCDDTHTWNIKYYKGLGSSTGKEFREYFENQKIVYFKHIGETSDTKIDMVFNKTRAEERKYWLENTYNPNMYLDTNDKNVTFDDFFDCDFIHFSNYDCQRSIPNLMDGLKTSLRKILYSAFKRNLVHDIKVAQLSGYVSEHSGYHHGESSLNSTIIGMAQTFVGSNNINLFNPNGQFGTRLRGGKDSASERYIYTQLNSITRFIYRDIDDKILNYLNDDGTFVEPTFYAPIIPMILVNGVKGIGTGFSTDIMCYNPSEIINYLKYKLTNDAQYANQAFIPYYEGFKGLIIPMNETATKYLFKGCYTKISEDKIQVTELPVGTWTDSFKEHLEKLLDVKADAHLSLTVKDFNDMSTDVNVEFNIIFHKGVLENLEQNTDEFGCNGVHKLLKLISTNTNTNMHVFDANAQLQKYTNVVDIIDDYFVQRLQLYNVRREMMIDIFKSELVILKNKARFIQETLEGTVDLRRKDKQTVNSLLTNLNFDIIEGDVNFKYLVKMTMDSVTEDNVIKINSNYLQKQTELDNLLNLTIEEMWLSELYELETQYDLFKSYRRQLLNDVVVKKTTPVKKIKKKKNKDNN